tara:strand:- start:310 stop:774 length:465 start_codon:yes stop_codon:yes gene_type:complete
MIIQCINCSKKFQVNSDLIPNEGRTIQCGSCGHTWFFKKKKENDIILEEPIDQKINELDLMLKQKIEGKEKNNKNKKFNEKKIIEKKVKKKSSFSIIKLLYYFITLIITFIALIIIIDTFKRPLYQIYPNLEIIIFSLFETLRDMNLFLKDLFK